MKKIANYFNNIIAIKTKMSNRTFKYKLFEKLLRLDLIINEKLLKANFSF